jgi:prepilin-type processing-associated H-X9-DG protein
MLNPPDGPSWPTSGHETPFGRELLPSDRFETGISQTNYGISIGPGFGWTDDPIRSNGVFRRRIEVRLSDITDGTSNTVMMAERLIADGSDSTNSIQDVVAGVGFTGGLADDTPFPAPADVERYGQAGDAAYRPSNPPAYSGNCSDYFSTGFACINEAAPPNWRHHDVKAQGCIWRLPGGGVFPARSKHPGGVNAALCDGSVRFISETIDGLTWQYLGARADDKAVTVP